MSAIRFAFCEQSTATTFSHWHIREVGDEGLKLSGGAPGNAVCGRDLRHGWDLKMPVDAEAIENLRGRETHPVCPGCAEGYAVIVRAESWRAS